MGDRNPRLQVTAMDGTASTEQKAPPPTADGASSDASVEVQQRQQPEPLPAGVSSGAAVKDESVGEEDEQVERFFALLANIQALRGMYGAVHGGGSRAAARERKRAREAEPPWRPAFRLEDFEEQEEGTGKKKKKKIMDGMSGAKRPAGTSTGTVAVADDGEEDDGEVVETRGPEGPPGRRVVARG